LNLEEIEEFKKKNDKNFMRNTISFNNKTISDPKQCKRSISRTKSENPQNEETLNQNRQKQSTHENYQSLFSKMRYKQSYTKEKAKFFNAKPKCRNPPSSDDMFNI